MASDPLPMEVEMVSAQLPAARPVSSASAFLEPTRQPDRPRAPSAPLPGAFSTAGPGHSASKATTGLAYDTRMSMHAHPTHPESPARIKMIYETLKQNGFLNKLGNIRVRPVEKHEAMLVHSEDHWDKVEAIQNMDKPARDAAEAYYDHLSLYINSSTTSSAKLSCGGVVEACLDVAKGKFRNAFAIVRPPGHHAEPDEHMGFCFFNNVAVAARVVQQDTPLKRILILDWDVHHGNGTQRAFYDDPSVLYISLHRYEGGDFYPGGPFGGMQASGEGAGLGRSVNIPWPEPGMTDADYLYAFIQIVLPIAYEFAPELVIISAGFDAAAGDELGECFVSPAGYAHMTAMLATLAGGKVVAALEGGYNIDSISESALAVTRVLTGESPPPLPGLEASMIATETVWQVAKWQSRFWKSINPKTMDPSSPIPDATFSLEELLKAHRQKYLFETFGLQVIPFADPKLQEAFEGQVMCSKDIYNSKDLVLFIHDFGALRVELESALNMDVHMEHSYLVDTSRSVIEWTQTEKFGLFDINVFPKPQYDKSSKFAKDSSWEREALIYLWDNYVDLGSATNIILIGYGAGGAALCRLIEARAVTKKIKAVVQVVMGRDVVPSLSKDVLDDVKAWYYKNSLVIVPPDNAIFDNTVWRRFGRVQKSEESHGVKALADALPVIRDFVKRQLEMSPSSSRVPSASQARLNGVS